MYLSRLILNPRSRQVQREIGDPYQLHRTIMAAFPETLPDGERILHRLEQNPQSLQIVLLVQSQTPPDWSALATKDYCLPLDPFHALENPAVKEVSLTFHAGQQLRFRLRANPVKRLFRNRPEYKLKKGQRIGLFREEDQRKWLQQKGGDSGFTVETVAMRSEGFSGGWTKDQQKLKHYAVCFDGILQVTDTAAFLTAIQAGIGSGKAFGFGLLSVAPVR